MEAVAKEVWIDINERYSISNFGNVRSNTVSSFDTRGRLRLKKGKSLSLKGNVLGYPVVNISGYGMRKQHKVHQLVAKFFIPNPNNLPIINHKDGNKSNNHIDNLEWCTYSENNLHAFQVLKRKPVKNFNEKNGYSKRVKDTKTGIVYESLKEVERQGIVEFSYSLTRAMLNGQVVNRTTLIAI